MSCTAKLAATRTNPLWADPIDTLILWKRVAWAVQSRGKGHRRLA
ncbi:MAG: hypothetical protein AVDCRST_MAG61-3332 [uncultured Friedmanniella sp.]|uniref:Uncharacterized protein n=1 Tax=uncultured Friedmanniella sp. TaxID=335381 RepID=A0A6J4LP52_9ACTN|nr:MAG: hypothetical protein AVDCRST_MAG61-3332 [uncultured Friedmanniella sp.]